MKDNLSRIKNTIPITGADSYKNPLPIKAKAVLGEWMPESNADPFVIKYNGEYYCYSTHIEGVILLQSKDLLQWEYLGFALKTEGEKNFWAPSVIYHNGLFYMYYSSMKQQEEDVHREFMKVAISTNPEGPFEYCKTLFNYFSIDAHVVMDEKKDYYLYYTVSNYLGTDSKKPGTVILVDRMLDLTTPQGTPRLAVKPTLQEEIFQKNRFGDGRDWYCVEGPFHLSHRGKEYLMFSGNDFTSHYYFVGYSVKNDMGEWEKYPNDYSYTPLIRKNENVEGTGHNSVVRGLNNVDHWFIYHGRDIKKNENGQVLKDVRKLRMDPLFWSVDRMWIAGPSFEEQPAPNQPAFIENFDAEDGTIPSNAWEVFTGNWIVDNGQLLQKDLKQVASSIIKMEFDAYVFEISLKWKYSFMGGLYGVYASYEDSENNIQILLDPGKRQLVTIEKVNGIYGRKVIVQLEESFNFECYHHLKICKLGELYTIYLDYVPVVKGNFINKGFKIGLTTQYTNAFFDGIAVTRYMELCKDTVFEFLKIMRVKNDEKLNKNCWAMVDGSLQCNNCDNVELNEVVIKNICGKNFQISIDFKLLCSREKGMVGMYLTYKDEDNYMSITIDNNLDKIMVIDKYSGTDTVLKEYELPSDFQLDHPHSIIARIQNRKALLMLDDYMLYHGTTKIEAENIGLICKGGDAFFSGIQIIGI